MKSSELKNAVKPTLKIDLKEVKGLLFIFKFCRKHAQWKKRKEAKVVVQKNAWYVRREAQRPAHWSNVVGRTADER